MSATVPTTGAESGAWAKNSGGIAANASRSIPNGAEGISIPEGTDGSSIDRGSVTTPSPTIVIDGSSGGSSGAAEPMAAVMARTEVSDAPVTITLAAIAGLVRFI